MIEAIADTIEAAFISPNEQDRNLEPANVVDGLFAIARSISAVAKALEHLGTADAATPMGAIELLSSEVHALVEAHDRGMTAIAEALEQPVSHDGEEEDAD